MKNQMIAFNWTFDFDPLLPVYVFPYSVSGNKDKLHWHDYYEIGLCTRGDGRFMYVNKEYGASTGDIFVTNNFENHVAISEDEGIVNDYIFLIFMPSFIANPGGRHMDLEYLFPFDYNPMEFENKLPAHSPSAKILGGMISDALDIYSGRKRFYKMELDIKLREILLEISRHYLGRDSQKASGRNYVNVRIQKAIQYMNLHFSENLSIAGIAEILDMSPSYFRHLFTDNTRVSFKQYITHLRMSQAKKLLLATDKTVSEIIDEVGYNNISQFYRTFKKYMFMSPAEYRDNYRVFRDNSPSG